MNKAVFFDRDGVINNPADHYYIYRIEDFKMNPGIIDGMKLLQDAGYRIIVISNQGGISKGIFKKANTEKVHAFMRDEFESHSIFVDEVYYCPHHSDIEKCFCRKPDSILIEKALARFSIEAGKSYLIGDSQRDIEAGGKVGLTCFLIYKNENVVELCRSISSK